MKVIIHTDKLSKHYGKGGQIKAVDELDLEVPSADTDMFEIGLLDSLKLVEMLFQLEQEFGVNVSIDDLDIENFRTIDRIARFLSERSGSAEATGTD